MRSDEDRFWEKVQQTPDCWTWTAARYHGGYGAFSIRRDGRLRPVRAHRYAWELVHGPIPDGLLVCHHCDNPPCVKTEPDEQFPTGHLFLGTTGDNRRDAGAKGRLSLPPHMIRRGMAHERARFTDEDILTIRRLGHAGGLTQKEIGAIYGIEQGHVSAILRRHTWRHI